LKKPSRNRKGVSSVFIALYLALILTMIGSTLFYALQTSNATSVERLQIEQEKEQESLLLQIDSITVTNNLIDTITVNNTGSITVRIKGIYIGSSLVLDPSAFQDTYINPQNSLTIDLLGYVNVPFAENKYNTITITTERGTQFTQIIANLFPKIVNGMQIDTTYGPLKLIFEEFHWTEFKSNFDMNYLKLLIGRKAGEFQNKHQ